MNNSARVCFDADEGVKGNVFWNLKLQYVFINNSGLKEMGFKKDEVIGKTDKQLGLPTSVADSRMTSLQQVIDTKKLLIDFSTYKMNDQVRYFVNKLYPQLNSEWELEGIISFT
jgi:hypothetical protein